VLESRFGCKKRAIFLDDPKSSIQDILPPSQFLEKRMSSPIAMTGVVV